MAVTMARRQISGLSASESNPAKSRRGSKERSHVGLAAGVTLASKGGRACYEVIIFSARRNSQPSARNQRASPSHAPSAPRGGTSHLRGLSLIGAICVSRIRKRQLALAVRDQWGKPTLKA